MDKKKIIKIVIIILVVILALIGIENLIRGIARVTEDVKRQNQIKKEEDEYENSYESQLENYLETSINEAIGYLASGDFETFYSLLDSEYKDYMNFRTVDEFKEYIKGYIGTPQRITLMEYYQRLDKYVCTISIMTSSDIKLYTILLKQFSDGTFSVIFDNISSIENVANKYTYSDSMITYNIRYRVKRPNEISYSIDVTNNSSSTIKGSFSDSCLNKSDGKSYYVTNKEQIASIEIAPQATERVIINIDNSSGSVYEEITLNMNLKLENGEEISKDIVLEEYYW